jgi:outer membrane receptor protein involved in Fe transport
LGKLRDQSFGESFSSGNHLLCGQLRYHPGSSQQIHDWTTVDLQYAYKLQLRASQAMFILEVKNAFDEEPPVVYDAAN